MLAVWCWRPVMNCSSLKASPRRSVSENTLSNEINRWLSRGTTRKVSACVCVDCDAEIGLSCFFSYIHSANPQTYTDFLLCDSHPHKCR